MTTNTHAAGPSAGSGRDRYLLGGDPALLREIAGRIATGGLDATVRGTVGSAPDVLVIEAGAATVARLRADHPGLVIEADEVLPDPSPAWPPWIG